MYIDGFSATGSFTASCSQNGNSFTFAVYEVAGCPYGQIALANTITTGSSGCQALLALDGLQWVSGDFLFGLSLGAAIGIIVAIFVGIILFILLLCCAIPGCPVYKVNITLPYPPIRLMRVINCSVQSRHRGPLANNSGAFELPQPTAGPSLNAYEVPNKIPTVAGYGPQAGPSSTPICITS
jgi:hypothetical protein